MTYLDRLFGEGAARKHARFLARIEPPALREAMERYHLLEDDERHLDVRENYLIGMCVLAATGHLGTAEMFARALRHLGVPREKIMTAVGRLEMWIGGVPAAEAALRVGRAVKSYDEQGLASMAAWFPDE